MIVKRVTPLKEVSCTFISYLHIPVVTVVVAAAVVVVVEVVAVVVVVMVVVVVVGRTVVGVAVRLENVTNLTG